MYTVLHAGGKFGGGGYKVSGGLHGVGASVVNALSEWMEVRVKRNGHIYEQNYKRGHVCNPLKIIEDCDINETGTLVKFLPDKEIFQETQVFEFDILKHRLREMAFLTKGIKISLEDKRPGIEQTMLFHYEGGIKEFVQYLNKSKDTLYNNIIYCEGEKDKVQVEVAFQHNDGYNEVVKWTQMST